MTSIKALARETAIYAVDDALAPRHPSEAPDNARFVTVHDGFEGTTVAVWSHLRGVTLTTDEALDLAVDYLTEVRPNQDPFDRGVTVV